MLYRQWKNDAVASNEFVQGIVYSIDETTGGLEISHRLVLPTKDYPGCPGPVTGLRWARVSVPVLRNGPDLTHFTNDVDPAWLYPDPDWIQVNKIT